MNIIIYTTPTCKYCKDAKAFFTKHGLEYEEINILENENIKVMLKEQTGRLAAPIIQIDSAFFVGFNESELSREIGAI